MPRRSASSFSAGSTCTIPSLSSARARWFRDLVFKEMNEALGAYKFDIRKSPKACVETDIMITEEDVPIESKGRGRQCFIKTEFALRNREHSLDVLLLEEPENHLSHVHMHSLIERIRGSLKKQILIATPTLTVQNDIQERITLESDAHRFETVGPGEIFLAAREEEHSESFAQLVI
jgi:hypothetical protein